MTKHECAIVTAHTGINMLEGDDFYLVYEYIAKIMKRPVYTHEFPGLEDEIRKRSEPDFLKLCREATDKPKGEWLIGSAYPHHVFCSVCHKSYIPNDRWQIWVDGDLPRNFCPNCGAEMTEERYAETEV